MPIILTQNEVTATEQYAHWEDIEGVQYHFPNTYIGKIKEGQKFIYYRGSRRATGSRNTPEYFGYGQIGKVYLDPSIGENIKKKNRQWFCRIENYIPFLKTVPFKIDNFYVEDIASNLRTVGVRSIDENVYQGIVDAGTLGGVSPSNGKITENVPFLIPIENVNPILIEGGSSLLVKSTADATINFQNGQPQVRRTKYAKLYGDRAEEIVKELLINQGKSGVRWVAPSGEKPGWDIEYKELENLISVEVKGTSGKRFTSIQITENEWQAATTIGAHFHLYLVADCLSASPIIQIIEDPAALFASKIIDIKPILYSISLNG